MAGEELSLEDQLLELEPEVSSFRVEQPCSLLIASGDFKLSNASSGDVAKKRVYLALLRSQIPTLLHICGSALAVT